MIQKDLQDFVSTGHECPTCGRDDFKNEHGLNIHRSQAHRSGIKPWQDKERLEELYVEDGIDTRTIADRLGCDKSTVLDWLEKHNLNIRTAGETRTLQLPAELDDKDALREMYVGNGMTITEMADSLGCSHAMVQRKLADYDIERRSDATIEVDRPDPDQLHEWYWDEGLQQSEIAERVGVHWATVRRWMDEDGVPVREPSERHCGPTHYNWQGGVSIVEAVRSLLPGSWRLLSEEVRDRDNHECQMCGVSQKESYTSHPVHHLIPIRCGGCHSPELLTTLCKSCHRKAESYTKAIPEVEPVLVE